MYSAISSLASTSADAESLQREIAQISRLLEEENKKDLQDVLEQQRSRLALCRNQLAQQEMDLAAKEEALKDTAAELETVQTKNAQKTAQLQQLEQEYRQARQEAEGKLRALCEAAGLPPVTRLVVLHGNPAVHITEKAHDCDLIVIGKHGGTMLDERLLGSITQNLLYRADCNVLLVP